ncbi:DUF2079 domain-containing protein [Streptacidiphilus sp. P02-A3a]|uniref:DUF2079 domain-containing protein n=1 Tax=Streptacidiphilus sp. P02-A3a TaxID=2704468 RepID=UPI0015F9471E|nr:DUF2079 domain-containing protein [Streptacidiphilus sp. P02-A3a]QMU69641.1 DUF2079 domain-containing protein [Streptacidiphilus sp. P02-A3a]
MPLTTRSPLPPGRLPAPPAAEPGPAARPAAAGAAGAPRWTWGAAALLFAVYAAVSVQNQQHMLTTGYDLGIFEQAVRSYAHGHLPVSALKGPGFPLLGDHFSPILATLAPFYLLWPSPMTLLLAQAALLAVGVVPLARWAQRAAGRTAALVVAFGYGGSWGIASAVGFDFHEVAFAVPLLAFSLTALAERRMRAAVAWALPLLLVKEDLGLTVAAIGVLVAWYGHRRLGLATALAGVLGSALEILVLIPAFNPSGTYAYWGGLSATGQGPGGLLYQLTIGLVTPDTKVVTLVLLLAPTAFTAVRSPLLVVAVPTLLWRFVSTDPSYWGTGFQYSADLMPIAFAAMVDALSRWPGGIRAVRAHLVAATAATAALLPQYPLFQLAQPSTWSTSPRVAVAHRILALIPDGATVSASNRLAPQLTSRTTVSEFGYPGLPLDSRWIVVDTADPQGWPISGDQQQDDIAAAEAQGYRTVADQDGFLLLYRR